MKKALLAGIILALSGCAATFADPASVAVKNEALDALANDYVKLTLEAGTHDPEWVDAYYGPPELQAAAQANPRSIADLRKEAVHIMLAFLDLPSGRNRSPIDRKREDALYKALVAAYTRFGMLDGNKPDFITEAQGLFATTPELRPLAYYDGILANLDQLVPGAGPLSDRVDAFNEKYVIPAERLKPVFDAAIAECRRRTAQHVKLPKGESFTLEFVTGKPWSGYNYYKGNYHSLIQVNTDLPVRVSRAVDLGCHEGYPGHHVLNLLTEEKLSRGRGWKEFEVNPLYSPTSVISEGSANYGIDLAFPSVEKLKFERDVIYPLAGLDPKSAQAYYDVQKATDALSGARLTIAELYLDGKVTREEAIALTQKYQLVSRARAEQSIGFTDHYRSYVINYGWGKDLVKGFIERGNPDEKTRWQRMEQILSEPTLPSDLQAK